MNLFALIENGQDMIVNRVPVSQAIQAQLNQMFTQLLTNAKTNDLRK